MIYTSEGTFISENERDGLFILYMSSIFISNQCFQSVVVMLYLVHVSYCTVIDLFDMVNWFKTGIKEGYERK